jgi:catechol 2,3-dioxygenase-like lactoylglutathione lyase family enzyme
VAVRQTRRWHLTDIQRLFVAIMVAVALFLAFMAVGMGSGLLLAIALLLLVLVGLLVFLLGLRHAGQTPTQGEARVLSAPPQPIGSIVSPCQMRLWVDIPGRQSVEMRHRDPSVSVTKWPRVGTVLPVEVDARNKSLRVRWDRVAPNTVEPATPVTMTAREAVPFYIDYADGAPEPSRRGRGRVDAAITSTADEPRAITAGVTTTSTDPEPTAHLPAQQAVTQPAATQAAAELDADSEVRARAAEYELPMRRIPQPRPSEGLTKPDGVDEDDDTAAMGAMLVVSDLQRSVGFYRDQVGLRLVDQASNAAVLSYGGGRVLLRQLAGMSQVDRRVSHLHIQVSDVDASYREMMGRGVEFVHAPRVMSLGGDRLNLWAATFRDPDGHDIALTQWRTRE